MSSTPKEGPASTPAPEQSTSEAAEAFFQKAAPKGEPVRSDALEKGVARYARRSSVWRSPTLLLLVIGVSGWLLYSMRADLAYFFTDPDPVCLGDLDGYDLSLAEENAFVVIDGLPHQLQAQYKQFGRRYRVYPFIGTRVFVREPMRRDDAPIAEDEHPSFARRGRLLDIRTERTYANVRSFFHDYGRFNFSEPAWILLADVTPRTLWWVPVAYVALGAILILNVVLLGRRLLSRRR